MDYQLELKQIVDYPRCRIYREFLQTLMKDKGIRTSGSSYLFYYVILCSYANFRSSYRKLEGISYLIGPGEWVCSVSELSEWFRTRFQHQALSILEHLQKNHYLTYTRLGRGNLIKFSISGWNKHNTALDYNYPCLKDVGFFFFPIASVHELISMGKCSEMDIVLDLWVHAIYNDGQVEGSEIGPVVYFRNCTGSPLISYSDLALRWGISKATVCRILNKLQEKEYLSLVSFTGRHGSVIYLCSYLSTMFNISDVMIDKEEVSMIFQVPVHTSCTQDDSTKTTSAAPDNVQKEGRKPLVDDSQIIMEASLDSVSVKGFSVSKSDMKTMIEKVAQILAAQGVPCCECPHTQYKLYPLSDCKETGNSTNIRYHLQIGCPETDRPYRFELTAVPLRNGMDGGETGISSQTEGRDE